MASFESLKDIVKLMEPAMEASLDAVGVVDASNQLIYWNSSMKSFLGLRVRELQKGHVFCDLVKLSVCDSGSCKIKDVLKSGQSLRLDETPAARGKARLRILLKAVPVYAPSAARGTPPLGAILTLRDSTGEVLLQAKYHKVIDVLEQKEAAIIELEDRVASLRKSLRDTGLARRAK